MRFNKLMKLGLWSMIGCTLFASMPLLSAILAGFLGGRDAMHETTSEGAWLKLMQISLPVGFLLGIVGFILFLVGLLRSKPSS